MVLPAGLFTHSPSSRSATPSTLRGLLFATVWQHTCCAVRYKSIWDYGVGEMWSATCWRVRSPLLPQPSLVWHVCLRITASLGLNTSRRRSGGFRVMPSAWWALHRFFWSMYFPTFVIGSPDVPELRSSKAHLRKTTVTLGALAEACGQALTILAVLWVMFGSKDGRYDHFYLCFIPIIWIAMRHGIRRVVTGLLAVNFGIVIAMHLFPPTSILFAKVALLMLVLSAVGLIVGSEVSERQRLAIDLNEQTIYLDSLIQNSPLGIIVLDMQGRVKLANSAFEKLFQYDRRQLASIDIESMAILGRRGCRLRSTDSSHIRRKRSAQDSPAAT